jgi:hypothetical protein
MRLMSYARCGLLMCLAALVGCSGSGKPGSLSGTVKFNGQPARYVTVVVTSADGKTAGGTANENGVYLIPDPPKGTLKFQILGGRGGNRQGSTVATLPPRYARPDNGLGLEYTGGKKTFDIELTP